MTHHMNKTRLASNEHGAQFIYYCVYIGVDKGKNEEQNKQIMQNICFFLSSIYCNIGMYSIDKYIENIPQIPFNQLKMS